MIDMAKFRAALQTADLPSLAQVSGVSVRTLQRLRRDGYLPSVRTVDRISSGLRALKGRKS